VHAGADDPSFDPSIKNKHHARVDDFKRTFDEKVWPIYPRKVAKADALKAFCRLAPNETTATAIVAAITAQKTCEQWRRGYVPNLGTWLRQERWNDEQSTAGVPRHNDESGLRNETDAVRRVIETAEQTRARQWVIFGPCPHFPRCSSPSRCLPLREKQPNGSRTTGLSDAT
jgi:hypothetical protein